MNDADIRRMEKMKDILITADMLDEHGNIVSTTTKKLMEQHNLIPADIDTLQRFMNSMKPRSGNALG